MKSNTVGSCFTGQHWSRWARRLFASTLMVATAAVAQTYSITTHAGDGTIAVLVTPESVALDGFGNIYSSDSFSRVRRISPVGVVTNLATNFGARTALAVDSAANVFVADTNLHVIKKVDFAGNVTVVAGQTGSPGVSEGSTTTINARFNTPTGIAVNTAGTVVYVADTGNQVIRRIDLTNNTVTTIAGTQGSSGNSAVQFNSPHGLAISGTTLFVADRFNHSVRRIDLNTNTVTTLAGIGASGATDSPAAFNQPTGVAVDGSGNVFVADFGNHAIRRIASGVVTTVAGLALNSGFLDAVGSQARFNGPWGIAIDGLGNFYVGDSGNQRIRKGTAVATSAPTINLQPSGTTYTLGVTTVASFNVSASGNPAVSYQWQRAAASSPSTFVNLANGTANGITVNGVNSPTLTVTAPALGNNGDVFKAVVTNGVSPDATSNQAILTVITAPAPTINLHPQPAVLVSGQTSVSFTVIATASPAVTSYQWERSVAGAPLSFLPIANGVSNGVTYTGATTSTLNISGVNATLNGDNYRVVVSNGTAVTSNSASLSVPPVFLNPTNTVFATGQANAFQFIATGNPAPSITLTSGTPPTGIVFTPGTGSATLSGVTNDSTTVVVGVTASNSGGSTTQLFTFSAQPPGAPTIISPNGATFTVGQPGLFHFQAVGSPTPNFSLSGPPLPAGVIFNSPTLSGTPQNTDGSPLTYTVIAQNSSGNSTTQTFTLTVLGVAPIITSNPTTVSANVGSNATFSAGASGTPTPLLRWQRQPSGTFGFVDLSDSGNYAGTATPTLTILNIDSFMGGDQFRLSAFNGSGGAIYSLSAQLLVSVGTSFSTVAGFATLSGSVDSTGSTARFNNPNGVATDSAGNVYIADTVNHTIRKMTPTGVVTTYAGVPGLSGSSDGVGNGARFNSPQGVAVDSAGSVYVADTGNHTIRVISTSGTVTTVAGAAGVGGSQDGFQTAARFLLPTSLVVDLSGTIYVADSGNHAIRQVLNTGTVTTYAGVLGFSGSSDGVGAGARFNGPNGIARDVNSNLYVADTTNHIIRKITPGAVVTTLAGGASQPGIVDGTSTVARFNRPTGLAVDLGLNVYVADKFSNTIRKITSAGDTTTVAGFAGVSGTSDGTGTQARFNQPSGIAIDSTGNIYITDTLNHTIRKSGTPVAPSFTVQPVSRTVAAGGSVTFTATAAGSPTPGYQWQRQTSSSSFTNLSNDGTYSGVNTSTLTVLNVTNEMTGEQFRVVANNGVLPVAESSAATLTVGLPPVFTSPTTASFQALQAGTFTVTVTSTPAATFSATGLPSWATINTTTGQITGTPPDTSGSPFTVTITATNGASSTQTLSLIVTAAPPTIATQPANTTSDQGQTASFAVTATGTPPFTYQWRRNGAAISGATASTLQLTNVQPSAQGVYSVVVSNSAGNATSNGATLTVNSLPTLTSQPSAQVALSGTSATFGVTATGGGLSYQWRRNGVGISGANAASYTINNVTATDAGNFDVLVSNPFGTVNSSLAQLTVVTAATAPVVTVQPAGRTALVGTSTTFAVGASGAPSPGYQWRKDGSAIAGANGTTYTIASVGTGDSANYDVVVSNSVGSVTSASAGLTVITRSFAGIYFGTFSNNLGDFALYVRDDNTAAFLGYLPATSTPITSLSLRVNDSGTFSFSSGTITIGGTINSNGTLSGSILGGVNGTFGGDRANELGTSQGYAGFYQAGSGNNAGVAYAIAGGNGVAVAVVQAGAASDGGRGVVSNNGVTTVTTTRSVITLNLSTNGTLTGTSTGPVAASFSGASDAVLARQRLVNISSRARVGTGDAVVIAGFVISGEQSKPVLIRAVGPTLGAAPFSIPGALASPRLELFRGQTSISVNAGIGTNRAAIDAAGVQAAAFALGTAGTDAAILTTLAPGNYTAVVSSTTNTAGVALVEVYDLSAATPGQKLLNIATRAPAGTAENMLIAGFVVPPGSAKRVLIRGVGPGLTPFGVTGVVAQPTLTLQSGATTVATNTNWSTSADSAAITSASAQVGAFGLANLDSAMVVTLAPGNYTAQVTGAGGATGVALIEVYEIP